MGRAKPRRSKGYIRSRKGSPYLWYDFTVKGRRFRGSTETASEELAQTIAAKLRSEALLGTLNRRKPRLTLDEAAGRYWAEHGHRLPSAADVQARIDRLLSRLGRNVHLDDLDNGAVAALVARRRGDRRLLRNGLPDPSGRLVAASTVNADTEVLRAIINRARAAWGAETPEIDWKVHRIAAAAPRDRYLTVEEADRLLKQAAPHLVGPLLFALCTGARRTNTARLDWSQIDMHGRVVTFRQKSRLPGGKPHSVPLADPLWLHLANLGPKDSGPVWLYEGRPLRDWTDAFANACRRAGIKGFRWHDLRHTAASWLVMQGVPLTVVQEILGHADIRTTRRYSHLDPAQKRTAVDVLGAQIRHTAGDEIVKAKELRGVKRRA